VSHRHRFRVRYVDCDAQRVMHNAHYLAYVDDALDSWFRSALGADFEESMGFDVMVKQATIEWQSPARVGDEVDCVCSVARWGTSSFDVEVTGRVGNRDVFTARLVQISTVPGEARSTPIPDAVRVALRR
jgi:acyl-CoA thioester hydrolase